MAQNGKAEEISYLEHWSVWLCGYGENRARRMADDALGCTAT